MANNDQAQYTIRFNEISGALEFGNGNNWTAISLTTPDITAETISSDANLAITAADDLTLISTTRDISISAPTNDAAITINADFITLVADNGVGMPQLASDPSPADLSGGEMWFNTGSNEWRGFDGTDLGTFTFTAD